MKVLFLFFLLISLTLGSGTIYNASVVGPHEHFLTLTKPIDNSDYDLDEYAMSFEIKYHTEI